MAQRAVRTVGVEEELFLIDPESREAVPRAARALKYDAEHHTVHQDQTDPIDHELYRHQLETRTPPVSDLDDLAGHLIRARARAIEAAAGAEALVAATGTAPLPPSRPVPTRDQRYLAMIETYGEVARPVGTCGMHVHVGIDSPEEGVRILDTVAPWLPLVLAVSVNSPFVDGRDSGHASWRAQVWSRWPSAGPAERFGSLQGYRDASRRMVETGAARDEGMLYYDARLSHHQPTVEVRVADVCTDIDDAVVVAALVRALVQNAADGGATTTATPGGAPWRAELLRAAHWRASRYGLAGQVLDPRTGSPAPAREVLEDTLEIIGVELAAAGDADRVANALGRLVTEAGAVRQRASYERSGRLSAVVDDLVERTAAG